MPRIMSEAFSAIMSVAAFVFASTLSSLAVAPVGAEYGDGGDSGGGGNDCGGGGDAGVAERDGASGGGVESGFGAWVGGD